LSSLLIKFEFISEDLLSDLLIVLILIWFDFSKKSSFLISKLFFNDLFGILLSISESLFGSNLRFNEVLISCCLESIVKFVLLLLLLLVFSSFSV
jgi:hypothetical protein